MSTPRPSRTCPDHGSGLAASCPQHCSPCGAICPRCLRRWPRCCAPSWWRCFCSPLSCSPTSSPPKAWSTPCWWAIFCSSTSRSTRRPARLTRWLLPYRDVARGDIVVFHHPDPPLLVKRVVGLPGDRLRIEDGRVTVNGSRLDEPYAAFEPAPPNPFRDNFPATHLHRPEVDPDWWKQMQSLTRDGELVVPPGRVLRARRQPQPQQGFPLLGLCSAPGQIVARPLVIYFSLAPPLHHRC